VALGANGTLAAFLGALSSTGLFIMAFGRREKARWAAAEASVSSVDEEDDSVEDRECRKCFRLKKDASEA
jgi:hypothetical protein